MAQSMMLPKAEIFMDLVSFFFFFHFQCNSTMDAHINHTSAGSPYANFAGHDASRGLAKNSFDEDMMVDPHGPIDKLEDLEADDWQSLREWVNKEDTIMGWTVD